MIGAMLDLRLFPAVDALFGYRSRVESDFCAEVWVPESVERTIEGHESPAGAGGRGARPTAVNLLWAMERMLRAAADESLDSTDDVRERLIREAQRLADEDVEINRRMADHGAALI